MFNKRGVSLAELLAVVVIMGIIAAIAVPLVSRLIEDQRKDALKGDAYAIADAVRLYCLQNDEKTGCASDEAFNFMKNSSGKYTNVVYHEGVWYKHSDEIYSENLVKNSSYRTSYNEIVSSEVSQYLSKEFNIADYHYVLAYGYDSSLGVFVRILDRHSEYLYAGYPLSDGTEIFYECEGINTIKPAINVNGLDIPVNCQIR